jgi:multidrug resistance efflux pump
VYISIYEVELLQAVQLQSWLELLCRMIPGVSQAVLLPNLSVEPSIQWPPQADIHDDLMTAASLAASQKKTVTTSLSAGRGNDSEEDMVIALHLTGSDSFSAALAILVSIKPSRQSAVLQILHWGESWLQLLIQQQACKPHGTVQDDVRENGSLTARARHIVAGWSKRSRGMVAAALVLGLFILLVPGTYRVTAPASLEGSVQRAIVAPFDGFILHAHARAGENVAVGQVIAELDSKELLLEQQRYSAERDEYNRQYRQALSDRDMAQSHIFKSQVSQAEAQLRLLEKKIQRSSLLAPLQGVIIKGDLSRSLGATVEKGEVLFEVAPLDEYRLVILVDEQQVIDVQPGLQGELTLKALPDNKLAFTVQQVSPVFEENASGIAYRVEAGFNEANPSLRPGMQGIAKISIDQRSYLWIFLHELIDAISLWGWSWLP